jgi:hypothetical protein
MCAPAFMTQKDAALYIATENEDLKGHVEKILKRKKNTKRPDSFKDITKAVLNVVIDLAKNEHYLLHQIQNLAGIIQFPNEHAALQCTDNHYVELDCDDKTGLSPYYFLGIRR